MSTDAGSDATESRRPLRRDAEENRRRIVRAARDVFAVQGLGAGLNDIARHAGVGVATVYRRFPDKTVLVREALRDDVDLVLQVADEAMAAPSAWDGLMLLIEHIADLLVSNLGLRDIALGPGQLSADFDDVADQVRRYVDDLLQRAREEGTVRPGVTGEDFTMMYFMITELAMHATPTSPRAYRRYLAVFTDGLRATRFDTPLPDPLESTDAEDVARRWTSRPASSRRVERCGDVEPER